MTDAVKVSSVDVQRARLLVRLNQTLGTTSPDYVVKIASAQPASAQRVDGAARTVNGVSREAADVARPDPEPEPER